jgi:hypothetical protein
MKKTKLADVSEVILEYVNSINPNELKDNSIILTNGIWDVYLDYTGTDYESAVGFIRNLANYKKKLLMEVVYSTSISEILSSTQNLSEYMQIVSTDFSISVGSRKNPFLNWVLRARIFLQKFF